MKLKTILLTLFLIPITLVAAESEATTRDEKLYEDHRQLKEQSSKDYQQRAQAIFSNYITVVMEKSFRPNNLVPENYVETLQKAKELCIAICKEGEELYANNHIDFHTSELVKNLFMKINTNILIKLEALKKDYVASKKCVQVHLFIPKDVHLTSDTVIISRLENMLDTIDATSALIKEISHGCDLLKINLLLCLEQHLSRVNQALESLQEELNNALWVIECIKNAEESRKGRLSRSASPHFDPSRTPSLTPLEKFKHDYEQGRPSDWHERKKLIHKMLGSDTENFEQCPSRVASQAASHIPPVVAQPVSPTFSQQISQIIMHNPWKTIAFVATVVSAVRYRSKLMKLLQSSCR